MVEDYLACGEEHPLRGEIHRRISGLLNYVERLEVDPHRMSWVGEAATGESISHQKVTELIVNAGRGDRQNRRSDAAHEEA